MLPTPPATENPVVVLHAPPTEAEPHPDATVRSKSSFAMTTVVDPVVTLAVAGDDTDP